MALEPLVGTTVIDAFCRGPSAQASGRSGSIRDEKRVSVQSVFAEKKFEFGECVLDEKSLSGYNELDDSILLQDLKSLDAERRQVSELEALVNALDLNKDEEVQEDKDSEAGRRIVEEMKACGNWPPLKARKHWKQVLREEERYARDLSLDENQAAFDSPGHRHNSCPSSNRHEDSAKFKS